jgi:hypothetical protein
MIDTDKYGDMTMKDITAPIDEKTGEPQQIPARWEVKLCWTEAYSIIGGGEVICNLTGNKDSANRKEWAELIADAPLLLAEVKRLQDALKEAVEVVKEMEGMAYAGADADKFANHTLEFIGNVKELIE